MTSPGLGVGLLRAGGLLLAVPLTALREVVPAPRTLGPATVRAPGLRGVTTLRGSTLVVVDAATLLAREQATPGPRQVVAVVADAGRLLGLLVDELGGRAVVDEAACDRLDADVPLLAPRTFLDPAGSGEVVHLLDPAALLGLPGVPVVRDRPERETLGRRTDDRRALVVVEAGGSRLALDIASVHSMLPSPRPRHSPVAGELCLGVTAVAGEDVPVVDLPALLGLGAAPEGDPGCGLVLDLPQGRVVLAVSAMLGLHDVPHGRVSALPPTSSPSPDLLPEVADVDGLGPVLVVAGQALRDHPVLTALGRLVTGQDGLGDPGVVTRSATGPDHLCFEAGLTLAVELAQVVEVLGWPAGLTPRSDAPGALGVLLHRGVPVPVTCLATALDRPAPVLDGRGRLLLVEVDGAPAAWAVSALHAIAPLGWTDPDQHVPTGAAVLRSAPLVQLVGRDDLVPRLDLHALTRAGRPVDAVPLPRSETAPRARLSVA